MSEKDVNQQKLIGDDPLVKLSKGKLAFSVIVLYLLNVSDFVVRVGINSIFPLIQRDLALSDTQLGSIASAVLFGMAVFVLPVSYLAEKYNKKNAIVGMGILWSLSSLLTGFVKSFPLLLFSRFSIGVGNGGFAPTSVSVITTWFRKTQWGKIIGLYNTASTVGIAGGAAMAGILGVKFGWRGAIIGLSTFSLIVSLLSFFIPKTEVKDSTEKKENKISIKKAIITIIKNKTLLIISVFYGLTTMISYSILAWLPIYCIRIMEMSVPQAGGLLALVTIAGTLGFPIGGFILDKWYRKEMRARVWLPAILFVLSAITYSIGFAYQLIPWIIIGQIIWSAAPTCIHTSSQDIVPFWFKAVAYGLVVVFLQGFGALGPVITGALSERFGIQNALIAIQVLYLVAALGFVWAGTNYKKDHERSRNEELNILKA